MVPQEKAAIEKVIHSSCNSEVLIIGGEFYPYEERVAVKLKISTVIEYCEKYNLRYKAEKRPDNTEYCKIIF